MSDFASINPATQALFMEELLGHENPVQRRVVGRRPHVRRHKSRRNDSSVEITVDIFTYVVTPSSITQIVDPKDPSKNIVTPIGTKFNEMIKTFALNPDNVTALRSLNSEYINNLLPEQEVGLWESFRSGMGAWSFSFGQDAESEEAAGSSGGSPAPTSDNTLLYVGLGGAALIGIGLMVYFATRSRKED